MKIFRWLLSHSLLILVIVAVIYSYMFWGNLAGEDTPAGKAIAYLSNEFVEVEEFVNAVKAKQSQQSGKQSSEDNGLAAMDTDAAEPGDDKLVIASVDSGDENDQTVPAGGDVEGENTALNNRNIAQQPVSISYSHNQMQVKQDSAGGIQTERYYGDDKPAIVNNDVKQNEDSLSVDRQANASVNQIQSVATNDSKDVFVTREIEKQLGNVDQQGKVKAESPQSDVIKDAWITARKSFYQRKYELSEQSYQKVIDNTDDNFDAYGELGNVYFNQGKNEQAASAYYEAAAILVRKGELQRARSLMGLLRHLDKSKAKELQELIDSTLS